MTKKKVQVIVAIALASILFLSVTLTILFWGKVEIVECTDDYGNDILDLSAVGIETSFRLSNVDSVAITYTFDAGSKISGFSNAKIKAGVYENALCGEYYLFINNSIEAVVYVYLHNDTYIAFNCNTLADTLDMYTLLKNCVLD